MNSNAIQGEWKKAIVVPIYKGGRSIGSWELQTSQLNLAGLQANGACYSRVLKTSLGNGWVVICDGQHGFRPGYSCKSQVVTVCQDITDSLDEGVRTDAIIIDFSKAFDLVSHDKLLTKIVATGVNLRVVVWVKEFVLGHSQQVRVDGQLSEDVTVTFGVPQGSVLGPLLFFAYGNDIWRNTESDV